MESTGVKILGRGIVEKCLLDIETSNLVVYPCRNRNTFLNFSSRCLIGPTANRFAHNEFKSLRDYDLRGSKDYKRKFRSNSTLLLDWPDLDDISDLDVITRFRPNDIVIVFGRYSGSERLKTWMKTQRSYKLIKKESRRCMDLNGNETNVMLKAFHLIGLDSEFPLRKTVYNPIIIF